MKNFAKTNTITHNLMSFSGFKALLIFSLLVQKPCTYKEIKYVIDNNEYLKEKISIDTIRVYLNSFRKVGCDIKKIKEGKTVKYFIDSHPFEFRVDDNLAQDIIKVYNSISKEVDLDDYLSLQKFFNRLALYIDNETLKQKFLYLSPVKNTNENLIAELKKYILLRREITISYNSSVSGIKDINIIPDKLHISNGKLYLSGYSFDYENYSGFLVSKIIGIKSVNIEQKKSDVSELKVVYEYYKSLSDDTGLELNNNEKIIEESEDKVIVEITTKNEFFTMQRILSLADKCKVVSPQSFKNKVISVLKQMKEEYIDQV